MSLSAPTASPLAERFRPIFRRIAQGTVQRENERALAYEAIGWLRDAGFGALRVPVAAGGLGASVEQLFDLLIELGEADSNLPQALRAHFGFIERLYAEVDPCPARTLAAPRRRGRDLRQCRHRARPRAHRQPADAARPMAAGGEQVLGTLYADWISVAAQHDNADGSSERVLALVPPETLGVERLEDWRGFGQRLSASVPRVFEACGWTRRMCCRARAPAPRP
jgi:alkylation response protein AidB-like acyl-CoA dehydrogenase